MGWSGEQLRRASASCPRLGEKVILGLSSVPGWNIQMNQLWRGPAVSVVSA